MQFSPRKISGNIIDVWSIGLLYLAGLMTRPANKPVLVKRFLSGFEDRALDAV